MKTELMLTFRPIRHVFFVSDHDLEQFLAIAIKCCTQWGGINNLIIPVDVTDERSGTLQREMLFLNWMQQRHPDCFINALPMEAQTCSAWKRLASTINDLFPGKPLLTWDAFCQESEEVHPASLVSPDEAFTQILDSNSYIHQKLIPAPTLLHYIWSYVQAAPSDIVRAFITTAFGDILPRDRAIYPLPRNVPIDGQEDAMIRGQMSKAPFNSVINLTLKELKCLATVSTFPSLTFDVVIAQDVSDFCRFWNLRAFSFGYHWLQDRRILLLTKEQLLNEQYHRSLFAVIEEYRGTPSYLAEFIRQRSQMQDIQGMLVQPNLDVIFHYQNDDEIHQFLQAQKNLQPCPGRAFLTILDEQGKERREEIHAWEGAEVDRPLFYAVNRLEAMPSYYEYGGTLTPFFTEVTEGANTIHVPSSQLNPRAIGQVRKDIKSSLWESYLPSASVASLVASGGYFDTIAEDVEPVFSYPSSLGGLTASTQRISFTLPKTDEMYRTYFRSQGYEVEHSDKWTFATGLLNLANGIAQADIFRSRIACQLLDSLNMRASQKLAQEIKKQMGSINTAQITMEDLRELIIASNLVPRYQRNPKTLIELKQQLSSGQKPECLNVLSQLVQIGAVQRGWNLLCPYCGVTQWYGLGLLNERVVCQGCLETFNVPLTSTGHADTDRPLQYALNPLADRAMDQDVLPVIIALLALRTVHTCLEHVVPGMKFQECGVSNAKGDFDFLYVCQQQLYGGECKKGQILMDKDIQTAKLAQHLGFRAFFFATIGQFSPASKQLVADFQASIQGNQDLEHPFNIFLLEEQQMFDGPLPEGIPPVTAYKEIWSQAL